MGNTRKPVAFIADCHMGNYRDFGGKFGEDGLNERARICLDTLGRALKRAALQGCATVYVCGDLFDNRRPEPALVAGVQNEFEKASCEPVIIPGNHDLMGVHAEAGNTAVQPLLPVATVINKPRFCGMSNEPRVFLVPFDGRRPMRDVIKDACKDAGLKGTLAGSTLVTHVGIVDDSSPPWLKDSADAMHVDDLLATLLAWDMPAAFVGNYHEQQTWKKADRVICQVGALCPTGFDNEGLKGYGGLAVWDGENFLWESVPGPRFVKVSSGEIPPTKPEGCKVFVRADRPAFCHQGDTEATNDNTQYYDGYEEVDAVPAAAEQDGVKPEKLLESAEEAIEEYVTGVSFSMLEVDKAKVLDMVKGYWRRA